MISSVITYTVNMMYNSMTVTSGDADPTLRFLHKHRTKIETFKDSVRLFHSKLLKRLKEIKA